MWKHKLNNHIDSYVMNHNMIMINDKSKIIIYDLA